MPGAARKARVLDEKGDHLQSYSFLMSHCLTYLDKHNKLRWISMLKFNQIYSFLCYKDTRTHERYLGVFKTDLPMKWLSLETLGKAFFRQNHCHVSRKNLGPFFSSNQTWQRTIHHLYIYIHTGELYI